MQIGRAGGSDLGRAVVVEAPQGAASRGASDTERLRQDVAAARDVARSALANERFGRMLEQMFSPSLSDALMRMTDHGGSSTDLRTAQLRYEESVSD